MADPTPTYTAHQAHGSHSSSVVYSEDFNVELYICTTCHFIEAYCQHKKNSWDEAGENLTCDFCGIDGT